MPKSKTKKTVARQAAPRKKGRPPLIAPEKRFAGKSYFVTTFRLRKETVEEADAISDMLSLGSRTAAVQYAIRQVFQKLSRGR